jgi:hypothetical protein
MSGQNGEVHFGTIKVPLALHFMRCIIALLRAKNTVSKYIGSFKDTCPGQNIIKK